MNLALTSIVIYVVVLNTMLPQSRHKEEGNSLDVKAVGENSEKFE